MIVETKLGQIEPRNKLPVNPGNQVLMPVEFLRSLLTDISRTRVTDPVWIENYNIGTGHGPGRILQEALIASTWGADVRLQPNWAMDLPLEESSHIDDDINQAVLRKSFADLEDAGGIVIRRDLPFGRFTRRVPFKYMQHNHSKVIVAGEVGYIGGI